MIKVGLFGGSFNPIHVGHIALAQAALKECGLDEVWLMVSPQNPLKRDLKLLDDALRLEMAQKALEGVEGIVACDYEFHLPKPSYTWNIRSHSSRSGTKLCLRLRLANRARPNPANVKRSAGRAAVGPLAERSSL